MENQHKLIKGYRDLSQEEVDLMNRIKEKEKETLSLISELQELRTGESGLTPEQVVESQRCVALAKTNIQTGYMWFVRSVALPE